MPHCNRHINCNHQGPKTEFPEKGLKNVSQGINVTYQNCFMHCTEMYVASNPPSKTLSLSLMLTIKVSVSMYQLPICEFS